MYSMNKEQIIKFKKVYAGISKNLKKKTWRCIIDSCDSSSINSHLLQQNGILDTIAEDNHLFEVKPTDSYTWNKKDPPLIFKKISVRQALSLDLFCNKHDSEIFKHIETFPLDFDDYKSQLLFSYRTICAEIRKKEHIVETYKRLLNSNSLYGIIPRHEFELFLKGSERGIDDLKVYKSEFELELENSNFDVEFKVYKYPLIKVYCSAAFNLYETLNTPFNEIPLKYIFVHVIPYDSKLNIIVGYNKKHTKESIIEYVNSWENLTMYNLELKLTNLFATKVENWGVSPIIYSNIAKETISDFINYFGRNSLNHLAEQKVEFNLFGNNNYGTQHDNINQLAGQC